MNYQSYEDYMRNSLGYNNMNYPEANYPNMYMNNHTPFQNMYRSDNDLERLYPDTYRVVYPMVVSTCNMVNVNTPITEDMVDRMTDDIYDRAEADGRLRLEDNMEVANVEDESSRQTSEESRRRRPRRRNRTFRDLIRILLLRELLRRRRRFPMRPF